MVKGKFIKIKLSLPAQEAAPSQAISVALGQFNVKINDFIKKFNELSLNFPKGLIVTSEVYIKPDGSFTITIRGLQISFLLKNLLKLKKLSTKDIFLIKHIMASQNDFYNNIKAVSILREINGILLSFNFLKK